jgi:hypothetical protein
MATAIFDVNPEVGALFEPWNSTKNHNLEPWTNFTDITNSAKQRYGLDYSDKKILLIKETAAHIGSLDWSAKTIENFKKNGIDVRVVWLMRDLNHTYLSRVMAAREWWGHEQMKVEQQTFRDFVKFALAGFDAIKSIAEENKTLFLSYEYLVKNLSDSLDIAMKFIGTQRHEFQLEYEKHFKKHKAAGDVNVSNNPKQPDYKMVTDRDMEWNIVKDELLKSLAGEEYNKYFHVGAIVQRLRSLGPMSNATFYDSVGW